MTDFEEYEEKERPEGVAYDKKVMLCVSRRLGHNRISVIAEHYLINEKRP